MQSVVIQSAEAALDRTEMSQGWLHSQPAFGGGVEVVRGKKVPFLKLPIEPRDRLGTAIKGT